MENDFLMSVGIIVIIGLLIGINHKLNLVLKKMTFKNIEDAKARN